MLIAAVVSGGVLALAALVLLDRIANRVVRPVPRVPAITVPDVGMRYEDLVISSSAHALHAWLLQPDGQPRHPLLIMTHGWGASYGTVLPLAQPLVDAGYEILLFDIRGHGRNAAVASATIKDFRDDVMAVTRFAEARFPGRPVILVGHSLGGSAGVLAVAEGAGLAGLGLLASPADVMDVTAAFMNDRGLPGTLLVLLLRPFWWLRLRGTFRPLTPIRRIREVGVPVLVVQPEFDRRVPMAHAERLAGAAGVELHVVAKAGHTDFLGLQETRDHVLEFLEDFGSPPAASSD